MKQLYCLLPIVLSIGLLSCSESDSTPAQMNADTSTTSTINSTGKLVSQLPDEALVIKVATNSNFAPYAFHDEYGNVTGFDVELMEAIGEDQSFRVERHTDSWENIFVNLDNKKRDMIASAVPYSAERASKYLLSDPYAPLPSTLLYLDDKLNIDSLNNLSNIKIGVLNDTVQQEFFNSGQFKVQSVKSYPTTFTAVQAMAQGQVDAVAEDSAALRYIMSDLPELQAQYFDYEDTGAEAARKVLVIDKDQPELLDKVNAGLKNLKENGTYAELTTKWFGWNLTAEVLEQQKAIP